ncbi:hypothetical protein [Microbulbifer elongatus]|uniref:hypothetical protein n=1 Tax=Microbulbifer elongatus TaxID=86173 RepID=UPI001CFC6BCC|nr:hypothetical protein [Microbulbifer elongatus]
MTVVNAAAGLALELMKFSLFPAALTLWRHGRSLIALLCYTLGSTLVAASLAASWAYFSEAQDTKTSVQLSKSMNFKIWQDQVSAVSKQISLLQQSASKDLENGYRARANSTLAKLREQDRLRSQHLAGRPENIVSSAMPIEPKLMFAILATLIELCAIAALMLPRLLKRHQSTEIRPSANIKPDSGRSHPETGPPKKPYKTLSSTYGSPAAQLQLNI